MLLAVAVLVDASLGSLYVHLGLFRSCCSCINADRCLCCKSESCLGMGALILGNLLQDFIRDESKSMDDRLWVWNRYGTTYRALYTLYEILGF